MTPNLREGVRGEAIVPQPTIRPLTAADLPALGALMERYHAANPTADAHAPGMYLSPGFQGGERVLLALEGEALVGYAPCYAVPVEAGDEGPRVIWGAVLVEPGHPRLLALQDALYDALVALARRIASEDPALPDGSPRRAELRIECTAAEHDLTTLAIRRGLAHEDTFYDMACDLTAAPNGPLPPPPEGLEIRRWRMTEEEEQRAYLAAHDACFPEHRWAPGDLRHFLGSPLWRVGTAVTAFSGEEVVGSVLVFWDPSEEAPVGTTDHVFTVPEWRGRGVAGRLLLEAHRYMAEQGVQSAVLVVRASNAPALALYRAAGYRQVAVRRVYAGGV